MNQQIPDLLHNWLSWLGKPMHHYASRTIPTCLLVWIILWSWFKFFCHWSPYFPSFYFDFLVLLESSFMGPLKITFITRRGRGWYLGMAPGLFKPTLKGPLIRGLSVLILHLLWPPFSWAHLGGLWLSSDRARLALYARILLNSPLNFLG